MCYPRDEFAGTALCAMQILYDSVLGKRVLTYCENRGNINHCHLNVPTVSMGNYTFLERRDFPLFKKCIACHGYLGAVQKCLHFSFMR